MQPSAISADTSRAAFEVLVERWRTMTIAERVDLLQQMHDDVETLAVAGIRMQHPDFDGDQVRVELFRRRYGRELTDSVYANLYR